MSDTTARSCIGCKLWTFYPGHADWSEVTPGDEWSAGCTKKHWYMTGYDDDIDAGKWFATMQQAKDCPDYSPRPGAPL